MPSIGKDLVKIRTHLGLTLEDIQYATKIPVHTLEKIENDTIYEQSEEGTIYIRSFVRSYGRALHIDEALMIEALDQYAAGNYQNLLSQRFLNSSADTESTTPPETGAAAESDSETKRPVSGKTDPGNPQGKPESDTPETETTSDEAASELKKRVQPETRHYSGEEENTFDFKPESPSSNVDWAKMGHRISQDKKPISVWLVGLILLVIILGVAGYFIIESDDASGTDPAQEEITTPPDETNGVSMWNSDPDTLSVRLLS